MLQICVEFVLRSPEDHAIQQPQLGPDPALRERGVADPEAVGIKSRSMAFSNTLAVSGSKQ